MQLVLVPPACMSIRAAFSSLPAKRFTLLLSRTARCWTIEIRISPGRFSPAGFPKKKFFIHLLQKIGTMQLRDEDLEVQWRQAPFGPKYWLVSNTGLVYSEFSRRLLTPRPIGPKRSQYLAVSYKRKGIVKNVTVHLMVATLFVPNPDPILFKIVNHKNGDKLVNVDWNLEWTDNGGNSRHAVETGLNPKKGAANHNAKLCEATVAIIKALIAQGISQTAIAKKFQVDQSVVSKIINAKIWKHATA